MLKSFIDAPRIMSVESNNYRIDELAELVLGLAESIGEMAADYGKRIESLEKKLEDIEGKNE